MAYGDGRLLLEQGDDGDVETELGAVVEVASVVSTVPLVFDESWSWEAGDGDWRSC